MPLTLPTTLNPTAVPIGTAQTVPLMTRSATWVRARNESPYQFSVDTQDGSSWELGAQEIMIFPLSRPTQQIALTAQAVAPTPVGSAPSSYVTFMVYLPADGAPVGHYPVSIMRQAAVSGGITVTNATILQNDTSPVGTQFIEATPLPNPKAGSAGSWVRINNDGSMEIFTWSANALRNVLAVVTGGIVSHSTVVLGDSFDPSMVTVYGALHGNADTATSLQNAGATLAIRESGSSPSFVDTWAATNNGAGNDTALNLQVVKSGVATSYRLMDATGSIHANQINGHMTALNFYSGTGPTTVTHGLGATPSFVVAQLTSGTAAIPVTAVGATTFVVGAAAGQTWLAFAFVG